MNNDIKNILFLHSDSYKQTELLNSILTQLNCSTITVEDYKAYIIDHENFIPNLIIINISNKHKTNVASLMEIKKHEHLSTVPLLALIDNENVTLNKNALSYVDAYIVKPIKNSDIPRIDRLINRNIKTILENGTTFNQRFKILAPLGVGGNGTVYKSLDLTNNKIIALKIMQPTQNFKHNYLHDFQREVFSFKELSHKYIVKLIDFGFAENLFYIATKFIKGKSLKEIISNKTLEEQNAQQLALNLAEALQYIQSKNMVYRDLKPENIIITENDYPVLIDLGLAEKEHIIAINDSSEIDGTPEYLSPEYISGKDIMIQSDLYALGVTLFYSLTGEYPFNGNSPMAILAKHLYEPPPAVNSIKPEISDFFSNLIGKMLIKNPDERIPLATLIEILQNHKKLK